MTQSSLVIAIKCPSSDPIGVQVAARVEADVVRILESADNNGSPYCRLNVRPVVIPRCSEISGVGSVGTGNDATHATGPCFYFRGTYLELSSAAQLFAAYPDNNAKVFSKLSD